MAPPTPPCSQRVSGLPDRRRPRRRRGSLAPLAALLLAALTLVACGGGTIGAPATDTSAAAGPAATPPAVTTQPTPPPTETRTATTPAPSARTTIDPPRRTPPSRLSRTRGPGGAAGPVTSDGGGSASDLPAPSSAEAPVQEPPPPAPSGTPLDERAELTLTDRESPAHYFQQGTVTGTYEGTMAAEVRITSKGVIVDFTATVEGGTIRGRALAVAVLDGTTMPGLRGTAAIHGGTGSFAGIHGRRLKVSGRSKPDGSHARVRLVGSVDY